MADVHVVDVGHGNCALAIGDGYAAMVDAAPAATVLDVLDYLGVRRLDNLIISHRDADHARGVVALLGRRELEIGTIFISADAAKDPSAPDTALLLVALDDAKRGGRCRVSRDLDAALPAGELDGGGLTVEVLAPSFATAMTGPRGLSPAGGRMSSNTVSAVVRITLPDGLRVLLPGDIDDVALKELTQNGTDLSADVLVFPHHGSHSAVDDERVFAGDVMRAVRPHTVLFSAGRGAKARPTERILRGIFDVDASVRVACTQLSRGCLAADAGLPGSPQDLVQLTDVPAAGRARCRSCAGSMRLRGTGLAAPDEAAHQAYLEATADRPMCRDLRP